MSLLIDDPSGRMIFILDATKVGLVGLLLQMLLNVSSSKVIADGLPLFGLVELGGSSGIIFGFLGNGLGCWSGRLTTLGLVTVLEDTGINFLSNLSNFGGLNLIICCFGLYPDFPSFLPFEVEG